MEAESRRIIEEWLEYATKVSGHELDTRALEGLQLEHVERGLVQCNFVIPSLVSDKNGNWHVGAMATLIDTVGGFVVSSVAGFVKASVDLNVSYHSTARIHEHVKIEGKVVGHKGNLVSVIVEVKKKENGEIIALGKQWMATINYERTQVQASKL